MIDSLFAEFSISPPRAGAALPRAHVLVLYADALNGMAMEDFLRQQGYEKVSAWAGEAVSLELRNLLFEVGEDIGDPVVLARVGDAHGVVVDAEDVTGVLTDHEEGVRRGVIGSPHFFTADGSFFCPALDVGRDPAGHLRITADPEGFESFLARCFA